ncbi:MAG: Ldh family oxidoreductase, partial [Betaproteobacteria bacterium]
DPEKLGTRESFENEATEFIRWVKQSPAPQGSSGGVLIAGDPERAARIARERDGIVVDDNTWAAIVAAGSKVGCDVQA